MSKKKIIIAALVAIVAIALGWYFLYFTKTPVYSLNLACFSRACWSELSGCFAMAL